MWEHLLLIQQNALYLILYSSQRHQYGCSPTIRQEQQQRKRQIMTSKQRKMWLYLHTACHAWSTKCIVQTKLNTEIPAEVLTSWRFSTCDLDPLACMCARAARGFYTLHPTNVRDLAMCACSPACMRTQTGFDTVAAFHR